MTLYPAIDLINGHCVRLTQGDFTQQSHYAHSPGDLAQNYRAAGAEWLHVIDLDAAQSRGECQQLDTIRSIFAASDLKVQCGGGIRSRERLKQVFAAGVQRAIVGSLCAKEPEQVRRWLDEFGPERVVLALDIDYRKARGEAGPQPYMVIHGWQEHSGQTLWQLLEQFPAARHLLCTDIERDGTLSGPNFALYRDIRRHFPHLQVQASGGIAALNDLAQLGRNGTAGAVLGKSLLEGRFTLEQALKALEVLVPGDRD